MRLKIPYKSNDGKSIMYMKYSPLAEECDFANTLTQIRQLPKAYQDHNPLLYGSLEQMIHICPAKRSCVFGKNPISRS